MGAEGKHGAAFGVGGIGLRLALEYVTERKINVFSKRWLFMAFSGGMLHRASVSKKPQGCRTGVLPLCGAIAKDGMLRK
jgi:hypothetical protein